MKKVNKWNNKKQISFYSSLWGGREGLLCIKHQATEKTAVNAGQIRFMRMC